MSARNRNGKKATHQPAGTYTAHHSARSGPAGLYYSPADSRLYLELLQEAAARYECHVHAYVLMTNHVHLLATPQQSSGISQMMQRLAQRYARTINRTCHRTGTLGKQRKDPGGDHGKHMAPGNIREKCALAPYCFIVCTPATDPSCPARLTRSPACSSVPCNVSPPRPGSRCSHRSTA
jgi:hypothetical protein